MNGSWFEEKERILSDINITPLVDVALVLLIIFMITAPMMVQGADVQLPRTQRMETLPESQLIVAVSESGVVSVNGEPVSLEDLEGRLSPLITPGRPVLFHGDERVAYGTVMQVMAIMQRLQADIGLVTEPIPERR
jgi:biopolymer transport protein TolR